MKRPTLSNLGIRWWYWLYAGGFGLFCMGAVYAARFEPQSKGTILLCGGFFGIVSLLAFLWPPLRIREIQGMRRVLHPIGRFPFRGVLIPISRTKVIITLIGGTVCGVCALLIALFGDQPKDRIEAALAFAVYLGLFLTFLWQASIRCPGILLTGEGVLWNDYLFSTGLVRWDEIADCQTYVHQGEHNRTPSLGIRFHRLDRLGLSNGTSRRLTDNFRRWGWHCYFHAESLLIPISTARQMIDFYRRNPEQRQEIAAGSIPARFSDMGGIQKS